MASVLSIDGATNDDVESGSNDDLNRIFRDINTEHILCLTNIQPSLQAARRIDIRKNPRRERHRLLWRPTCFENETLANARDDEWYVARGLIPVLLAFIHDGRTSKLHQDVPNLKMDSVMCQANMTGKGLELKILAATKKAFPQAIDVSISFCRWLGVGIGKHKILPLHRVDKDNVQAVLEILASTQAGAFGLAIEPLFEEDPGMFGFIRRSCQRRNASATKVRPHILCRVQ
jgi:hypothetical protein